MPLKVKDLALDIPFTDLSYYLHYPRNESLSLIWELPNQVIHELNALFFGLHDHHLIVARCESSHQLLRYFRILSTTRMQAYDSFYCEDDLFYVELDS